MKTKKEEYIDRMAAQLKEWSTGIDELERKINSSTGDVKAGYESRLRALKEKQKTFSRKLGDLRESSGEAWESMKTGVENAWDDFKSAIAEARDKFKKAA
jgi:uncharacterized coiled-coil DUF342 family protein